MAGAGRGGRSPPYGGCSYPVLVARGSRGFTCFTQWLRSRGLRWDGPLVPMLASPQQRLLARTAQGQQAGALSGKAACPPLLPFGLSCEQHFEHSLARADEPLPTEQPPLMDLDLQFAADSMAGSYGSLRDLRQGAVRALRELKSRWARVSTRLRHLQPDAIRVATQQRDLGLLPSRGAVVLGRCGHATGLRSGAPGSGVGTTLWHFPAAAGTAHLIGGCFL